ncbi:hypothetical protein JIG36_20985 [Actinoplanes sp. LDG1-06]|uniref:Transmembrane protein n=1 Tax=Paractinoplanes ovalisporus TaxID=2810368 RepID=A0ABS2AFI4_9ACTN|nr:DUF6232 family protein [Actinoplanes ovalisporus]MBM2618034.1 hypothetical protein [Actinoplanes ovalisporus]
MSKRLYYRSPSVVITDELFVRRGMPLTSYAVRDLHNVGVVRAGSAPGSPTTVLAVAAGTVAAVGAGWTLLEPPTAYGIGLLAVTVPLACTIPSMVRRGNRAWELRAIYRGSDVTLFSSFDEREFNQVKRALRRAIEQAPPPRKGLDLAAA